LVIASIIVQDLSGQDASEHNLFYKRFEGNISGNINVTANIVRLFDNVSGNYIYYFIDGDNEMYYGKTVELDGIIDENDSLKLREFGSADFTFEGLMNDGHYEGKWNSGKQKFLDFDMQEYYPKGSLPFDVYYLKSEEVLKENIKDSPTAQIELSLVFPLDNYFEPAIVDSVSNIITKTYFGSGFKNDIPEAMLENFENEYFTNYRRQSKDWENNSGRLTFNWEKQVNMTIVYNSNYLLCSEYLKYAYAGGAHGMSNLSYDIIDLKSGAKLSYADIFKPGSDSLLGQIITDQLRTNYKIPEEVSLKEAGFFMEKIEPNENIFINGEGIGFVYNSYEIAPYSRGATRILLSFGKIQDLIVVGSPAYQLSRRPKN
jgi:hypothetical protein